MLTLGGSGLFSDPHTVQLDWRVLASLIKHSNSWAEKIIDRPPDLKAIGWAFFSSNDIPRLYGSEGGPVNEKGGRVTALKRLSRPFALSFFLFLANRPSKSAV